MKQKSRITKTLVLIFLGFVIGVSCVITAGCGKGVPAMSDNSDNSTTVIPVVTTKSFTNIPVEAICAATYEGGGPNNMIVYAAENRPTNADQVIVFKVDNDTIFVQADIRFVSYDSSKDPEYVLITDIVAGQNGVYEREFRYRNLHYQIGFSAAAWSDTILEILKNNAP